MSALPVTWITETLIASGLLIALVLVLRQPAARLFGPHAAYLLWGLPALRLLLPPIPGGKVPGVASIEAPAVVSAQIIEPMTSIDASVALQAVAAPTVDWGLTLVVLWLAVAAAHLAWHIIRYRRFIGRTVSSQAPDHNLGGILVYSVDIAGPAAAGIVRRRILLPYDFADRFDPRERRLALAHEVAHHRRGDLVANWLALAVLSLHWFNPLAHIAYRAFRADQELACDATVLDAASAEDRHAYASAVVKAAWVRSPIAACPMNSAGQLKTRLVMMNAGAWSARRRGAGMALVVAVTGLTLSATASRTVAAPSDTVIADQRAAVAVPRRPAAPEATGSLGGRGAEEAMAPAKTTPAVAAPASSVPAQPGPERAGLAAAASPAALTEDIPPTVAGAVAVEEPLQPLATIPTPVSHSADRTAAEIETAVASVDVKPALVQTSAARATFPAGNVLKASARDARKQMRTYSASTAFRNVRAVMVDGRFNAADPGAPYIGFCGELLAGGQWTPFFVSTTPSRTPDRSAKCAGPLSSETYTQEFYRASRSLPPSRGACRSDQSACLPGYAIRPADPSGVYPREYVWTVVTPNNGR